MVSTDSLLGRRSSNPYDPAYSRPSDAPHRLHGRPAVAPSSDGPPCRPHPYHLAVDGRIIPYDRPAVAPRPLHPSDAPHRLHDRPAVAPSSDALPYRHHPYHLAADGRISPYDRPVKPPRYFPSDPTVIPGGPSCDPVAAAAASSSSRPLHPSDAPHRLHDRPAVAPSSSAPPRCHNPYHLAADHPVKPTCYFPSDPTVIPGGLSCDPVAAAAASVSASRPPVWHNRNRELSICSICTTRGKHGGSECPFLVLAFDGFMNSPPENLTYFNFVIKKTQGRHGFGVRSYTPPCLEDFERNPADAMSLHKDGIYLVRITNLTEDTREPDLLYDLFVKYGPVTETIVFPDQALGFVRFVREEDAQKAIKELNSCGFGHLMWATESLE